MWLRSGLIHDLFSSLKHFETSHKWLGIVSSWGVWCGLNMASRRHPWVAYGSLRPVDFDHLKDEMAMFSWGEGRRPAHLPTFCVARSHEARQRWKVSDTFGRPSFRRKWAKSGLEKQVTRGIEITQSITSSLVIHFIGISADSRWFTS